MAGHSAWKNIKHKKAAADAKRGKAWSKCARAIIVAARNGGGDPEANITLRYAIDDARAVNMPRDTIDKAIKKGTGELQAQSYDSVLYEGYGPGGAAVLLEILTDNRNRTAPEIKGLFQKFGGNLAAPGAVKHLFQARGLLTLPCDTAEEDRVMEVSLEGGATDVTRGSDQWQVWCEPAGISKARSALEAAGIKVESATVVMAPSMTVTVTGEDARRLLALMEALEDHDDVQKVHANFEVPDAELAALQA